MVTATAALEVALVAAAGRWVAAEAMATAEVASSTVAEMDFATAAAMLIGEVPQMKVTMVATLRKELHQLPHQHEPATHLLCYRYLSQVDLSQATLIAASSIWHIALLSSKVDCRPWHHPNLSC